MSDALGMSFGRLKALRRIDTAPRTMGELATIFGTDPPYMTIVVDDLERQGLVSASPIRPTAGPSWSRPPPRARRWPAEPVPS